MTFAGMASGRRFLDEVFESELAREWLLPRGVVDDALTDEMLQRAYAFQIAVTQPGMVSEDEGRMLLVPQYETQEYVLGVAYSEVSRNWYYQMYAVEDGDRWGANNGSFRFLLSKRDTRSVTVVCRLFNGVCLVMRFFGSCGFSKSESAICEPGWTGDYPRKVRICKASICFMNFLLNLGSGD